MRKLMRMQVHAWQRGTLTAESEARVAHGPGEASSRAQCGWVHRPYTQVKLVIWEVQILQKQGEHLMAWFLWLWDIGLENIWCHGACDSGPQGWRTFDGMVLVTLGHRAVAVQSLSCNPMDWSRPGFLVLHQLLEFAQTHIHWIGDAIQPSHPLSSPSPPAFKLSQPKDLFQWVSSSHQVAKISEFQLQHQSFQWIFRVDFL